MSAGLLKSARTWSVDLALALGLTCTLASGAALLAPLAWLDAAASWGDARLVAALVASLFFSLLLARIFKFKKAPAAIVVQRTSSPGTPISGRSYLR